jgi:hypothetical protein
LAGVSLHVDPGTGISTLTAVGRVTANEVIAALDEFYAGSPTLLALCDLSQADLLLFSTEQVARIVAFTIARAQARLGGRTAIVSVGDLEYGMARMYEVLAELGKHAVVIRAFRAREDASQWLREER